MDGQVVAAIIGAFAAIVAAAIPVFVPIWRKRRRRGAKTPVPSPDRIGGVRLGFSLAIGALVGLITFWVANNLGGWDKAKPVTGGAHTNPSNPLGSVSRTIPARLEPEDCRWSNFEIGLRITTSEGPESMTGNIQECVLFQVFSEREAEEGMAFLPAVRGYVAPSPTTVVHVAAFRVTNPGPAQTLTYMSGIEVPVGQSGLFTAPDTGTVEVTVTSVTPIVRSGE